MIFSGPATGLLELLLPRACLGCGGRIPPEDPDGLVCGRCRTLLRPPPPPRCPRCDLPRGTGIAAREPCLECADWPPALSTARAAVVMEPPADALVHALKYEGWRELSRLMGRRMAPLLPGREGAGVGVGRTRRPPDAVVVPVPTTRRRERTRGYNQARLLAHEVAVAGRLPLLDALERPGGRTQVRLGPRERRTNVHGSFRLRPSFGSRIDGRMVILIDDVLTTGATALSAAETLAGGGAREVHLITFARALPFDAEGRRGRAH